jgi:hypothetical protein
MQVRPSLQVRLAMGPPPQQGWVAAPQAMHIGGVPPKPPWQTAPVAVQIGVVPFPPPQQG